MKNRPVSKGRRWGASRFLPVLGAWGLAASVSALAATSRPDAQIEQFVRNAAGTEHRVEVQVGQLDPRIRLAPCQRIEPFVPAGARLWGRTTIGVRCAEGADWVVSLPITVRVFGTALVANNTLIAGSPASGQDFHAAEVDLTREIGTLVTDPATLDGKMMARTVTAGQPLKTDHLRVLQTVAPGDPVRIRVVGTGFEVMSEGIAMAGAGEGQHLRVRTENGKVLAGTVRDRTVEVRL